MICTGIEAQEKSKSIDELMSAYHLRASFEGSVLVAEGPEIIYKRGFGLANREWQIPNSPDVKYDVGSLTKTFTAVLTMTLVEQDKLELEGKITDYLLNYREDTGSQITLHHLLSHTSGLPPFWTREFVRNYGRDEFEQDYFIKTFCSGDLEFAPGTDSRYSDTNYYLLGRIIESVTGKTYAETLEEDLFKPLGMYNSGYYTNKKIIPKMASGYLRAQGSYQKSPFNNRENVDAAGASYTTVEDLFLFNQALYDNNLLSSDSRDIIFKPYAPVNFRQRFNMSFGYGWFVGEMPIGNSTDRVLFVQAGGNNAGFTAIIYRLWQKQKFVSILSNSGPSFFNEQLHDIAGKIIAILYEQSYDLPKHSIAKMLAATLSASGIEEATREYNVLKGQDDYEVEERSMNRLGYNLLSGQSIAEAIFVFKLNVDAYPVSFNAYDSLAEAYLANGDNELSRVNYKKSLELNPNNENARKQLKSLTKN